ncbi:MAG: plasmid recombination protein [Bacillus sp. (in: firmicutes)]
MNVTISTHNGTSVAREHNIRNEKVVSKEKHIDPNGIHETWIDEPIRQAYERLFGESVRRYNEKQNRVERKIDSYYNTICKDKKKHPVYEMIIGIYGKNEDGSPICSAEQGKEIMRKFVEEWQERNPNLELIGAYYHADEEGEPHVHLDYVPVAHGYKKGMDTQTGLVKALGEQGFEKQGKATAQIQWEKRENDYLTGLCEAMGLTVEHPQIKGKEHLETQAFKLVKRVEELEQAEKEVTEHFLDVDAKAVEAEERAKRAEKEAENAEKRVDNAERKLKETNAKHKVAATELKEVLDKKSRASEIRRGFFDREVQSYHANMLEATRAIGNEAYKNTMEAKKTLEQAELIKLEIQQKEQEIAPLHEKAQQLLQSAKADKEQARQLLNSQERLIEERANTIAQQRLNSNFHGSTNSREQRLMNYCDSIKFSDGSSALEQFLQQENQLEKQMQEQIQKEHELQKRNNLSI